MTDVPCLLASWSIVIPLELSELELASLFISGLKKTFRWKAFLLSFSLVKYEVFERGYFRTVILLII